MASLLQSVFRLGYELSPIILTNGVAQGFPGGMMPIILATQAANFVSAILGGSNPLDENNFFGHYRPLPGATLIDNDFGKYPFANQAVAANAVITNPLVVSLRMEAPANQPGGYPAKLVTFTALKATLDKHIQTGGTFTVATPAYVYTNCLLKSLRDVSDGSTKQVQSAWQWDFEVPLLALSQAQQVKNSLMSRISGGLPFSPNAIPGWSTISSAIGSVQTGLGALGANIPGLGSLSFGSSLASLTSLAGNIQLPGGLSINSIESLAGKLGGGVSALSNNVVGTAVSGLQSTIGNAASGLVGGLGSSATSAISAVRGLGL